MNMKGEEYDTYIKNKEFQDKRRKADEVKLKSGEFG